MYKLILAGLTVFIFSFLLQPNTVYALEPGPEVFECWDEEKSGTITDNCAQVLCSWDNVARNWPENTGFNKDCSGSTIAKIKNNYTVLIAGIVVATTVGTLWYMRRAKKRTSPK